MRTQRKGDHGGGIRSEQGAYSMAVGGEVLPFLSTIRNNNNDNNLDAPSKPPEEGKMLHLFHSKCWS